MKGKFKKNIEPVKGIICNILSSTLIVAIILSTLVFYNLHKSNKKGISSVYSDSSEYSTETELIKVKNDTNSSGVIAEIVPNIADIVTSSECIEQSNNKEIEIKIAEADAKINALDITDKMQWFIQYKQIQEDYSEWIDTNETIYDVFSSDELQLLFEIVEAEVTGEDHFQSKVNVASVIFNRFEYDTNDDFPDTLTEILKDKNQFSSYADVRYKKVTVTDTTKLACEYAWQIGESVNECVYFDSCNGNSWADRNREYVFTDSVGHSFYK